MKKLLLIIFVLLYLGCTGYVQKDEAGNRIAPNFQDGTWSSCIYTSKSGTKTTGPPIQLFGAPLERTKADGTGIKCVPIPRAE